MRKKIVAGNWKMNKSFAQATELIQQINSLSKIHNNKNVHIIVGPAFPYLSEARKLLDPAIFTAAQNCAWEESGPYTGEVSAAMIKSVGAQYVIVGHSERRIYFKEDNAQLLKKINQVLKNSLSPIFCIGESLDERQSNQQFDIIKNQIQEVLFHLERSEIKNIILAYEPVWAIGTGQTATVAQAQEMHQFIRTIISERFGVEIGQEISILYGGSCNAQNAKELFSCKDVDGGLIGGASLAAEDFLKIVDSL